MRVLSNFQFFKSALPSVVIGVACVAFTAGCTAVVRSEPVTVRSQPATVYTESDVVWADREPVIVESYPREYYAGFDVYLVDGRWYRRHGNRWQVYRTEPTELGRRRTVIEHRGHRRR
ncbi:MAG: hypothetical protein ABI193_27200 [Minicystis sp.]